MLLHSLYSVNTLTALATIDSTLSLGWYVLLIAHFLVSLSIDRSKKLVLRMISSITAVNYCKKFSVHIRVNQTLGKLSPPLSALYLFAQFENLFYGRGVHYAVLEPNLL